MDPNVNGQLQREWGWLIAIYLFLGGVGAGAYTIAAVNGFLGRGQDLSTMVGLWIGFPALVIGSLCLLADLGTPAKAILAGSKPGTSWMARGFWIISIFMVLAFLHLVVLWRYPEVAAAEMPSKTVAALSATGIVFAVMTMAYTGILLGASKGMPFWRSGIVPAVFVISALVTAHFAIMIGTILLGEGESALEEVRTMAMEATWFVVVEVLAIIFFLQAAYKLPDSRESAERILAKRSFVYGYFVLGLAAPAAIMLALYYDVVAASVSGLLGLALVGSVLGLAGGLILRQAVLSCGALPTLNIAGFEFRRIPRPKDPRPGIGLLPPE